MRNKKRTFLVTLLIVVVVQVVLMFQGLDVCDDGFVLTFYQQIFNSPESVEYNFLYWFSGIVGGVWYQIYPDGGILWFRVLAVLVNTATFVLGYGLLKAFVPQRWLLFGLVMALFVNDYGFLTYYHNQLTAFIAVGSIFIVYKAILKQSWLLFLCTGFVIGINVFTRIPNAVLFLYLIAIPFYYWLAQKEVSKSFRPMVISVLGIILSLVFVLIVLIALGQLDIMKDALLVMLDLGASTDSSHNFYDVIKSQYYNYTIIFKTFIKFLGITLVYFLVAPMLKGRFFLNILLKTVIGALVVLWFNAYGIYAFYTLALIGSCYIVFNQALSGNIRLIGFLSLITLLTLTLGTLGGIASSGYMAIWLGIPLFFVAILQLHAQWKTSNTIFTIDYLGIDKSFLNGFLWVLVFAFMLLKPYQLFNNAYFDVGNRLHKTHLVNNSRAKGVYTTEHRAEVVNDVLQALKNYVKKDDYLLVYNNLPMLHFFTETKPYLYNPWVGVYDNVSFSKKIKKAEQQIEVLPIVVLQKFYSFPSFSEPVDDYLSEDTSGKYLQSSDMNEQMKAFLTRYHYKIVWSNEYFNIYKPKEQQK